MKQEAPLVKEYYTQSIMQSCPTWADNNQ